MIRESIVDFYGGFEEILFADGFDDAIIGVVWLNLQGNILKGKGYRDTNV